MLGSLFKSFIDFFAGGFGRTKLYAAVVSLVVWGALLGQRPIVVSREVPVEYVLDPKFKVQDAVDKVVLTLEAKRSVLKDFDSISMSPSIDLRGKLPGHKRIKIQTKRVPVPVGVKVLSVEPTFVTLYLNFLKTEEPLQTQGSDQGSE